MREGDPKFLNTSNKTGGSWSINIPIISKDVYVSLGALTSH